MAETPTDTPVKSGVTGAPSLVLHPTTTAEENRQAQGAREELALTTQGQRHINVMWERTQQVIAMAVTFYVLSISGYLIWRDPSGPLATAAFALLSGAFFGVNNTYFQRSNHTKIGGVAPGDSGR